MKARVIKTGEVVNIIDKNGDYYIDTSNNPYKECELEFGIKDEIPAPTDPLMAAMRALSNNKQLMMQPALTFAAEVIKAKPHMCSGDLCEYVTEVITAIKKAL